MIIVVTTKAGDLFYLGANGVTKQKGRALNIFSKTLDKRIEAFKASEWYLEHGKGCTISHEKSPAGALGRPRKEKAAKRGRPTAKRGPGRPKGSKNKPKVAVEAVEVAAVAAG